MSEFIVRSQVQTKGRVSAKTSPSRVVLEEQSPSGTMFRSRIHECVFNKEGGICNRVLAETLNSCHRALYPIGLVAPSELSDAHNGIPALINYYSKTVTATICIFAKGDAKTLL